eukprot:366480-Chlamydomonas_euryale.AAC.10
MIDSSSWNPQPALQAGCGKASAPQPELSGCGAAGLLDVWGLQQSWRGGEAGDAVLPGCQTAGIAALLHLMGYDASGQRE